MKRVIDNLWDLLLQENPSNVCNRASVEFDNRRSVYTVVFLNNKYLISLNERTISGIGEERLIKVPEFYLLVLSYLIQARDIPLSKKQVSEKYLPGGELFFTGVHQLPIKPLVNRFGNNITAYLNIGRKMGGIEVDFGDLAFNFLVLPRIPIICILWVEDEEFPARISFLFDSTISKQLPTDLILALVQLFVKRVEIQFENLEI